MLFDTAGEDLTSEASVHRHLRYLAVVDAIVFLVDPMALPGAAPDVWTQARRASGSDQVDDPLDVIRRVTDQLRSKLGSQGSARLPKAVALALTKIDAIDPTLTEHLMSRDRRRTGRLDLYDRHLTQAQVHALLTRWRADSLVRMLEHSYQATALFGLSALGHIPREGTVDPAGISPRRVEDPLLWLLHRFGLISAIKHTRR